MYFLEVALFVAGLILLVVGYRKSHRNLMLCVAIILFLSAALPSAISAFWEGYTEARSARWVEDAGDWSELSTCIGPKRCSQCSS